MALHLRDIDIWSDTSTGFEFICGRDYALWWADEGQHVVKVLIPIAALPNPFSVSLVDDHRRLRFILLRHRAVIEKRASRKRKASLPRLHTITLESDDLRGL